MHSPINQLTISVFKKPLNECTVTELRQAAQQFPWFAPAQVAYAKKLQQGNASIYQDQVEKTSLFFQNRLWLDYLLGDYEVPGEMITEAVVVDNPGKTVSDFSITDEKKMHLAETPEKIDNEASYEPVVEKPDESAGHIEVAEDTPAEVKTMAAHPISHEPAQEEKTAETEAHDTHAEPKLSIPQMKIEPLDPNKSLLTFEPYHTVDYFASQGIKMKEEERPKDRFTQQLKSFTEWLKVMKKVPVAELEKTAEPASTAEKKVEEMAAHSVAERHIVTEAMAEVWIKQGNRQKAEEIYRKLSLLEPAKTAYFATKIEELQKLS